MFERHWFTLTDSRIWETENSRYIDEINYVPYLEWVAAGHTPPNVSADRFILIGANGLPYEDPNKAAILAAEAYAAAHPEPAMDATIGAACDMIDSILLGGNKRGAYFAYVKARWYTRDLTADELSTLVTKRFITAAERTAILAVEQVPI